MYTLDASVMIRTLTERGADAAVCIALLDALLAQRIPIIVPNILLAEVAGVIRRETNNPMRGRTAIAILQTLPLVTFVPVDDALAELAAEIAADRALRGADAIYVATARQYNCTLVTLDAEQRERGRAEVVTLTPQEALEHCR